MAMSLQAQPKVTPETLTGLLERLCAMGACEPEGEERIAIGDVLDRIGRRSYGPLLLFIGLFALSPITIIPGMTWLAAALTLLVAGQLFLGRAFPWLPRGALNRTFPRRLLVKGVAALRPAARGVDAFLKPRLLFLSSPPALIFLAALAMIAALATFPLGFLPGAAIPPSLAIALIGLGVSARDGLVLALGALAAAVAVALASGPVALLLTAL